MAAANSQYHIVLNGQGYILHEETYRRKAQPSRHPRFSTGDDALTDLSFWQFFSQTLFSGGEGQDAFTATDRYRGSVGWDFRDGKPRLSLTKRAYGADDVGAVTNSPSQLVSQATTKNHLRQKIISYGGIGGTNFAVAVCPGSAASASQLDRIALAAYDTWFYQCSNRDMVIWSRPQTGTFLLTGDTNQLYYYNVLNGGNPVATTGNVVVSTTKPSIYVPLTGNSIAIFDQNNTTDSSVTKLSVRVVTFTNNTWTVATNYVTDLPFQNFWLSGVYAFDSSGNLYVMTVPQGIAAASSNPTMGTEILVFSSSDITSSDGPRLTARYKLNNFIGAGLVSNAGTVYALGAQRKTSTVQQQVIVNATTQAIVWESPYTTVTADLDNIPLQYYQENPNEAFFIARSYLSNYDSIMRFRGGLVSEAMAIPKAVTANDNSLPAFCNNRFYWYDRVTNKILSSGNARGSLDSTGTEAVLELSSMGQNTNLITKSPFSVTVELSTALTGGNALEVRINDTTLGTMTASDGTNKEFVVTSDLSDKSFSIKLVAARTVAYEGYVKRVLLRYIPTQFKLKAWSFAVRADRNMRRIDGTKETLTPAQILEAIEAAWASNVPVAMTDRDGTAYSYVVVTDFDDRMPLIHNDRNKQEHLIFVEVLQAVAG